MVPHPAVRRQVGHHRAQGGAQGAHVGGDGAATRGYTFGSRFVGESAKVHIQQGSGRVLPQLVFDDLLFRVEGRQFIQPKGFDSDLDHFFL